MNSLLLFALLACSGSSDPAQSATTSEPTEPTSLNKRSDVEMAPFFDAVQSGASVIDVRTTEEFASGHVPGAVNVPISQLRPDHPRVKDLAKDKPIYMICAAGVRSSRGADLMASAGFTAVNVTGGTGAWAAAGHPLEK